jgi:hypothetical protein
MTIQQAGGPREQSAMRNLTSPRVIYFKAFLFLVTGMLACFIILLENPSLKLASLLIVAIWSFARAYYFAFYVIEHYIDPSYRYAGISSFLRYLFIATKPEVQTISESDKSDKSRSIAR